MKNFMEKAVEMVVANKSNIFKGLGIAAVGGVILGALKYAGEQFPVEEVEFESYEEAVDYEEDQEEESKEV